MATESKPAKRAEFTDKPVDKVVGDYPERPYSEAISDGHLEFLAANHPNRVIDLGLAK
jgi:hypothetical protein